MASAPSSDRQLTAFRNDFETLRQEIGKIIVGQREVIDAALTAMVAGGHLLIEGPPGLGKTVLARALAGAVGLSFQRIQFTPDLMPSDLLGTYVVMETPQGRRTFEFQKGPIFANLILADQINRGTPRTQSALLEAMEGQEVTVARESFQLPQPFLVVATQNPVEMEGTFPLPEPQLDRFLLKALAKPPSPEEMEQILDRTTEAAPPLVRAVADGKRLLEMRAVARSVSIDPDLRRRIIRLVAATHPDHADAPESVRRFVRYGASPRGAQAVIMAAKIRAAASARPAVSDADVLAVVPAALRHRLILNFEGQTEAVSTDTIIEGVLEAIQ
jgi:MoxR-like ATPase